MTENKKTLIGSTIALLSIIAGLWVVQSCNYYLFHFLAESFSIIIGFGIFMLAWNTRRFSENSILTFIGISWLFISILDTLHMLSFTGIHLLPSVTSNISAQLWISGRVIQAIVFLVSPLSVRKKWQIEYLAIVPAALFAFFILSIFYFHNFPIMYSERLGQSTVKIAAEYTISALYITSLIIAYTIRKMIDQRVFILAFLSVLASLLTEITISFYVFPSYLSFFISHIFKIVALYLIYRGIIVTSLVKPYTLLFKNLKGREVELTKALNEVKTLNGMLPICSGCKKIRDDSGYWQQVEIYIKEHSDADFTHSLCPECTEKYFPSLSKKRTEE